MTTPYLIIFEGRNGSSLLVSLLNGHPRALCYPEIMPRLDAVGQDLAVRAVAAGTDIRPIDGYAGDDSYYPGGFASKWSERPFAAVGFKAKVTDFKNIVGVMDQLEAKRYRLIYLRRANPLKAVVSWINGRRLADRTERWNARHPEEVQGPVVVDMHDFRKGLKHRGVIESLHQWFYRTYEERKMIVLYEDLLRDQRTSLTRVFTFLDTPPLPAAFAACFLKNTPDSLREAVLNYDELAREYTGTEFACYLD